MVISFPSTEIKTVINCWSDISAQFYNTSILKRTLRFHTQYFIVVQWSDLPKYDLTLNEFYRTPKLQSFNYWECDVCVTQGTE